MGMSAVAFHRSLCLPMTRNHSRLRSSQDGTSIRRARRDEKTKSFCTMIIHIGYNIEFELPASAEALFALSIHPSRAHSLRKPERLQIEPSIPVDMFVDTFGNVCGRASLPAGRVRLSNDALVDDSG